MERLRNRWIKFGVFYLLFKWLIRLASFVFVPKQQRYPSAALGWLLLIVLFPTPGLILYLLIGTPKLSRRRQQQQHFADEVVQEAIERARDDEQQAQFIDPDMEPHHVSIARLVEELGKLPVFAGNSIEFLPDHKGAIECILQDIDQAQRFVHVEYFMFADDAIGGRFIDTLIRAHQRGVEVRVLIDHLGNLKFIAPVLQRLRAAGIEAHEMLPVRIFDNEWSRIDLRNHRKIVVIDNLIGFTGSQNLIESHYHKPGNIQKGLYYEELVVRVTGPIVLQLYAVFAADWYSETQKLLNRATIPELTSDWQATGTVLAQVLPSGPGHETENNWLLFNALFHQARQRIVIATPYFVPDLTLRTAITTAAQRGITVILIVSGIADQFLVSRVQRSNYEDLLKAGVQIYLFEAPTLLHTKSLSIDDDMCVIGSSNMDMRSFLLDLEVSLVIYDRQVVAQLRAIEESYLSRSHKLTLEEWQQRSFAEKLVQTTAHLLSEFV